MDFNVIKERLAAVWRSFADKASTARHILYTPDEDEVRRDVQAYLEKHPEWAKFAIDNDAALLDKGEEGAIEELLTYQGLHAIAMHDRAHRIYSEGKETGDKSKLVEARRISQGARRVTGGIEIHPGAKIGENFFIDHGSGVVIGETAEIGNNVFLYHTVTLGATGSKGDIDASDPANPKRRHPKLHNNIKVANGVQLLGPIEVEDNVKIATGARVIGRVHIGKNVKIGPGATIISTAPDGQFMEIGEGAVIAAGVEVRDNVEPGSKVVGKVPELPGIISHEESRQPILALAGSGADAVSTKWRDSLARAQRAIAEGKELGL